MRGISPKQEVPRDAWTVHLANKIKYHWRPLLSEPSPAHPVLLLVPCPPPPTSSRFPPTYIHTHTRTHAHTRAAGSLHCPFKPDKYFEAYTYARLPGQDRCARWGEWAVLPCMCWGWGKGWGWGWGGVGGGGGTAEAVLCSAVQCCAVLAWQQLHSAAACRL